jgi:hypothetical protein
MRQYHNTIGLGRKKNDTGILFPGSGHPKHRRFCPLRSTGGGAVMKDFKKAYFHLYGLEPEVEWGRYWYRMFPYWRLDK